MGVEWSVGRTGHVSGCCLEHGSTARRRGIEAGRRYAVVLKGRQHPGPGAARGCSGAPAALGSRVGAALPPREQGRNPARRSRASHPAARHPVFTR